MILPINATWEDLRALRRREIELAYYLLAYGKLCDDMGDDGLTELCAWEDYLDARDVMPTSSRSGRRLADLELPVRPLYAGGTGGAPDLMSGGTVRTEMEDAA